MILLVGRELEAGGALSPASTSGFTQARACRVLRRSGLPRVTWSQGTPRDAAIHFFHSARAAPASGTRRTAGRSERFEPEFRRQRQGWGCVSVLVRVSAQLQRPPLGETVIHRDSGDGDSAT